MNSTSPSELYKRISMNSFIWKNFLYLILPRHQLTVPEPLTASPVAALQHLCTIWSQVGCTVLRFQTSGLSH